MIMCPNTHRPGRHCASSAIRDLAEYHGLGFDEPMCFGIGAGLGLWYLENNNLPASRMIHVRSIDIEAQFFQRIGVPFAWEQFDDHQASEDRLLEHLDQGRPALIQTDIFYLPYYQSKTHFPGHLITVWGYDAARRVFFVTDTERERVQEVPFDNLKKARFSGGGIFELKGNLFAPASLPAPVDLPHILVNAVIHNSRVLCDRCMGSQGLAALDRWRQELDLWKTFDDWQWTARLAYQVIEKRGTGGGGFRLMYAEFLKTAAVMIPEISSLGLPEKMSAAAEAWQELAFSLKAASEQPKPDFTETRIRLDRVIQAETDYHHAAIRLEGTSETSV
ncbi:MAG: DUF4872 domain-containing protein [Desulfobacteraceae bacterium]|jgi:hypothetical protein|nr:MAG: DUF4872 domain-containing protein [Desulfobacteraceae bacterium]